MVIAATENNEAVQCGASFLHVHGEIEGIEPLDYKIALSQKPQPSTLARRALALQPRDPEGTAAPVHTKYSSILDVGHFAVCLNKLQSFHSGTQSSRASSECF